MSGILTEPTIYLAESPEEIIQPQWLECPDDTPPILLPSHLFSPDVMI